MLVVGYCFGIRSERQLCEEVHLNLAYRWFCRLSLEDKVPDHSTFSKNWHVRFRGRSRRQRKKVEVLFAHLKRILRLRGLRGAQDEFLMAATAQNLRKMAMWLALKGSEMGDPVPA